MKKIIPLVALFIGAVVAGLALSQSPASRNAGNASSAGSETAIFAGGCFWCLEADFEKLPGIIKAESGYTGGRVANPSYDQVSSGTTGHAEAVRVTYDPAKVSYQQLLDYFWLQIDPTVADRQFCDIGSQYRSGIYPLNEGQRLAAEASRAALEKSGRLAHVQYPVKVNSKSYPAEFQNEAQRSADAEAERESRDHIKGHIYTEIVSAKPFYLAEAYHQDYYLKNPLRYRIYRTQCGRDARLKHIWKN